MRARALVVVALLVSACTAEPSVVADRRVPSVTVLPSGVQIPAAIPDARVAPCNPKESLRPQGTPGAIPPGGTMARIRDRGRLILGVGSSAYLLSHRDPFTGDVRGFEADIAREIAFALFGDRDPKRIQFRALNAAERIPAVRGVDDKGKPVETVDLVMAAMTMTCDRWEQVAFSAEYYSAGQKILVHRNSGIQGAADLAGRKVCASATSTNLRTIAELPVKPVPVAAANTSDCLLLLQQGQIDAVSSGDVILAGLAAQDAATVIVGERFTDEPTGIAMSLRSPDLVRFVNGVLENLRTSGKWNQLYGVWLRPHLPGAQPPVPQYKAE